MTSPDLSSLPKGQRRVAEALIGGNKARTYREVAARLELSLGTVYEHLRRIRLNHPDLYQVLMIVRRELLEQRHEAAVAKDAAHSKCYFKRRANFRYYQRFGYWPWERYVRKG
jgi:transposase